MKDIRKELLKIFDAIETDNYIKVREVLEGNLISNIRIPNKLLCGILIVAAEKRAVAITNEFRKYNSIDNNPELQKYINIANQICKTTEIQPDSQKLIRILH